MERWPLNGPCKADEADWQAGRGIEEEPQPGFILRLLVTRFVSSLFDVPADGGDEEQPGDEVSNSQREEGQANLIDLERPLFIHKGPGLHEHEDQGVTEATEERQCQDDWFREEHLEGADPSDQNFAHVEPIAKRFKLIGAPDVFARSLAPSLRDFVHNNGRTRFRDKEEMHGLNCTTKDKLDPYGPSPTRDILFDKSAF